MVENSLEPDRDSALPNAVEVVRAPESSATSLSKAFIGGNLGPTDDTATIISKALPNTTRGDEAMAEILRGRKLAHFELLEAIGVGGMAAVIRARDTQLDRTVALKVLPPDMAADPENVRRFQQEARAAAKLDHENIARVFYCGEDQGLHFIAFELVEGENLRMLLEKRGRLPIPEALSYVLQISTGLAHAAARSVVHRDIKPSNIIISDNGRAKLVDMGLARSLETHHDGGLTQSGVTLGTFDYISPEQALEPRQADARSDIYSLGCTFYQMITGQVPVPEGTAAKKLHHHQHVDPVDPRQLNPEISTNVALVLAKMLAKDPNDRYQHPEELVEHLIALARLEGGREEKPDGVLFVDARLPGPYIGRPILTTCAAVAALCVLVVVLGQSPNDSAWKSPATAKGNLPNDVATAVEPGENPDGNSRPNEEAIGQVTPSAVPETRVYHANSSGRELAEFLKSAALARVTIPAAGLKLSRDDQLEFDGKELLIEADSSASDKKPVLRLTYDTMPPGIPPWTILTVRGGSVRIRGIQFELDSAGADMLMNAVSRLGGTVAFEDCVFVQISGGTWPHKFVPGFRFSAAAGTAAVLFNRCYFAGGQQAIRLNSPLAIKLIQCAFGPHAGPLIDVGDAGARSTGEFDVSLVHCSAMTASESIFACRNGVSGAFSVENSVFARIDDKRESAHSTSLIRQDGAASERLRYSGAGNVYFNLSPFYVRMQDAAQVELASGLDAFHKRIGVADDQSHEVSISPWQDPDPVKAIESGFPRQAFRVNTTLAELRQLQSPKRPVGVEHCSWGDLYTDPLPPLERSHIAESPWRRDEKVVDPKLEGTQEGFYRTLRQAVDDARAEDVILIKHNGPLLVDSVRLERPMEITIRPFPGYKPILKLGKTTDSDAALFRLFDSHLRLEGLEIQLAPAGMQFKAQTMVAIMGDGKLSMKDCVVALEETPETPLYMVTLADPTGSGVIRMDPQPAGQQEPRVHLDNCFIRGAGDLVFVCASRPFELHVENSLVVLDGSFLIVDGAGKDPGMRNRSAIVLKQVTAYLTNHLVWLRASRDEGRATKGLTPTNVQSATDCIFASATGKALVHLDGFDAEEQMKRSFLWGDSKHNLYANYDQLLDQVPFTEGEMMPPTPYGRTEWGEFTKEPEVRFDRLRFQGLPMQNAALAKTPAADFRLKSESNLSGYGAELDRLPLPADDARHDAR